MKTLLIALILAAGTASAQCATGVTDNYQTLCGIKTFEEVVVLKDGIYLDGQYSHIQAGGGRAIYMRDSVPAVSTAPSFFMQTLNKRLTGELFRLSNKDDAVLTVDADGNLVLHGGAMVFSGLGSGSYAIKAAGGLYLPIGGQLPENFWGHHGAVQAANVTPMTAGFPFEVYNGWSGQGLARDHVFMVGYKGSIATQAALRSYELMVCDGTDVNPDPTQPSNRYPDNGNPLGCTLNPDGGTHDVHGNLCNDWYKATDAGKSMDGEVVLWVVDVRQLCQCDSQFFDGGLTSSWRKMSDRSECRP